MHRDYLLMTHGQARNSLVRVILSRQDEEQSIRRGWFQINADEIFRELYIYISIGKYVGKLLNPQFSDFRMDGLKDF